jgi:hypothetical protein
MSEQEKIRFEHDVAVGAIRVIEVDPAFYVQLMEQLQPEERWAKTLPDGRTALMLWTMASGNRELLFTRKFL